MSFVRVIPLIRTPLGVDVFDYRVPDGMEIEPGDLLVVPFRRQPVPALAIERVATSLVADRALDVIGPYAGIRFPHAFLRLISWTAQRTFCSQAAVLKAWLRTLPKKPGDNTPTPSERTADNGSMLSRWTIDGRKELIARANELLRGGKRVLIVTPWRTRADAFAHDLESAHVLHGDMSDGEAFRSWHSFINDPHACLITTRLGAWLSAVADIVLLDEPENDDHKQDELAPRYDTRLIVAWCAKNAGVHVEAFGLTPPLHVFEPGPAILADLRVHVRHPNGRSRIPMLQADTVEALRLHEGPRIIVHPIRGMSARLRCRDCGWEATCPSCGFYVSAQSNAAHCKQCGKHSELPLACGSCRGVDLGKSMPGIDRLKLAWQKEEPDLAVEWRDLSNESMDAPLNDGTMVAVTEGSLIGGYSEDIRRKERQCIAFRRLTDRVAAVHGTLIVQSDESILGQWPIWLTAEGLAAFANDERKQRALFGYPPSVRLVKAIVKGSEAQAERWRSDAKRACGPTVEIRGPYLVPHTPKSRGERRIFHLPFPRETSEQALIARLTPLASSAIIDLDPIAYFK